MRRWLLFLGGPLIWAAHFAVIYAIASISMVGAGETTPAARVAILVAGIVAAIAAALMLIAALRAPRNEALGAFWRNVAALGALIALVAIVWQTLPALAPI
jgi:cytochrome c biogenesis protein CcdA